MSRLLGKLISSSPPVKDEEAREFPRQPKLVVAHFMVGNTAPYTLADWEEDIRLASKHGIDGFALNVGKEDWQLAQVSSCFEAAERGGSDFKLFLSFDMSSLPSSTSHDIHLLKTYISNFALRAPYLRYRSRALVSTFSGENALFGYTDCESAWMFAKNELEEVCPIFFMPSFFIDPRRFRCMNFLDGAFNWNGCWPLHLSPDLPPEEIRCPKLLSDVEYLDNLRSGHRHRHRKAYMASVSPWFFTHYGKDSWNKNWIYRGDDWLLVRRWQQLINMRDEVDIVQIISWNDYGESHYIGPIKGAQPNSEAWVNGFDHTAWLHLCGYFSRIFKTGHSLVAHPDMPYSTGDDRVYVWARPHPRDADAYADPVGRPSGWELTEDVFWVVIIACAPAHVLLRSSRKEVRQWIPAGLSLLSCPLARGGSMHVLLSRDNEIAINFHAADFSFQACPKTYNFNASHAPMRMAVRAAVHAVILGSTSTFQPTEAVIRNVADRRRSDMITAQDLPIDVLPFIVGHLNDRMDLYNATLVCRAFYRAAVPILYEELDSRLISTHKGLIIHHPARTLIQNSRLAAYVRSIKESGTLHGAPQTRAQSIHVHALRALRLCTSLRSFSWVDDNYLPDELFLSILEVLKTLPLRELTIRTFKNLGDSVWDALHQFKGLQSVSIFCMEGPPRVLQGWSEALAPTLTHLDLGRCSGVPPTLLLSVFSHLRSLTHLRIKGAHSPSLPYFVAAIPLLRSLDTDYSDTGNARPLSMTLRMPALEKLSLRAGSIDAAGPVGLWSCAQLLLSGKPDSLREFRLQTFSTLGETSVPRPFILFMAQTHGATLERFLVGTTFLTVGDIACLCDKFPKLEELSCAIPNIDVKGIRDATTHAYNLRSIRLNTQIFSTSSLRMPFTTSVNDMSRQIMSKLRGDGCDSDDILYREGQLSLMDARDMMLRPRSRLRHMTVGSLSFRGEWVYDITAPDFVHFKVDQVQVEDTRGEA